MKIQKPNFHLPQSLLLPIAFCLSDLGALDAKQIELLTPEAISLNKNWVLEKGFLPIRNSRWDQWRILSVTSKSACSTKHRKKPIVAYFFEQIQKRRSGWFWNTDRITWHLQWKAYCWLLVWRQGTGGRCGQTGRGMEYDGSHLQGSFDQGGTQWQTGDRPEHRRLERTSQKSGCWKTSLRPPSRTFRKLVILGSSIMGNPSGFEISRLFRCIKGKVRSFSS